MNSLIPCPECLRHVRRSETSCPFCSASIAQAMAAAPERAMPTTRLGRAALFAFAAASVGTAACGGDDDTGTGKSTIKGDAAAGGSSMNSAGATGMGGEMAVPAYGAPFPSGGSNGLGGTVGAGGNLGAGGEHIVPPYGIPS